eukprot:gene5134-5782_t
MRFDFNFVVKRAQLPKTRCFTIDKGDPTSPTIEIRLTNKMMLSRTVTCLVFSFIIIAVQLSLGSAKKRSQRPKELTVGKPPPQNVMNGGVKVDKTKQSSGGDAPKEAAGKEELIDKQPTGQNTVESGEPPRYPINVESAEAQAHESRITGCRDHPDAAKVCAKAKDPCFCAEHESYTYSYCRKSCKYCNPKMKSYHKFWRLRAGSSFNPSWMISEVAFYRARGLNQTLSIDSDRAYSSSNYEQGFAASKAFDEDESSMWMPGGWNDHNDNTDWLAYEFPIPVHVGSIKLNGAMKYPKAAPSKIFVESADEKYGPFETKWMIRNPDYATAKVFNYIDCDVLWRRYETREAPLCFRLLTNYKNWMEAQQECQLEGGELASITSKEEFEFIMQDVKLCGFTWIGLNDRAQEGNFVWADSSASNFTRWKNSQVYDEVQRHYEDCVAMDADGNWFTFSCQNKFYFLCKKTLVDPADPIQEEAPAPETPEIQFIAPNWTTPVVGAMVPTEEEAGTPEEKLKEALASIAMSRMKELGLKPPEAVANLEVPPPDLGEQLHNLTEIALKNSNQKKIDKDMEKAGESVVSVPPGKQKPHMQTSKGQQLPPSKGEGITVLKVPSSPGQELIDDIPGVPSLKLPNEEENKEANEEDKQDENLSLGESGDEGGSQEDEDQGEDQEPIEQTQDNPKAKKMNPKQQHNAAASKQQRAQNNKNYNYNGNQQYQTQYQNSQLPQQQPASVPAKPGKKKFLGSFKKHSVAKKHGQQQPFSIKFAGKQVMNEGQQQKASVSSAELESDTASSEDENNEDSAVEQPFVDKEEDSVAENLEGADEKTAASEADDNGSASGSGLGGFDPDLEEEFLDLDVDDLLLFDIYRKVPKDLTQPTLTGAIISICSVLFIIFLMMSELSSFIQTEIVSELFVDNPKSERIPVRLNFTAPRMSCEYLGLDIQDEMGRHEVGFHENTNKIELNGGIGCRFEGTFHVNRVPGNFHVSTHGAGHQPSNPDLTHVVNALRFGDVIQDANVKGAFKALAGHSQTESNALSSHDYVLRVVPTVYEKLDGTIQNSFQYTWAHKEYISYGHGHGIIPAVWFRYDLSAITVKYTEKRKPLYHFITTNIVRPRFNSNTNVNKKFDDFEPPRATTPKACIRQVNIRGG